MAEKQCRYSWSPTTLLIRFPHEVCQVRHCPLLLLQPQRIKHVPNRGYHFVSPLPPFFPKGNWPSSGTRKPPCLWDALLSPQDLVYESTAFPHQEIVGKCDAKWWPSNRCMFDSRWQTSSPQGEFWKLDWGSINSVQTRGIVKKVDFRLRLCYLQLRFFSLRFVFFTCGGGTVSRKDKIQFPDRGNRK